ncbi:hypothetical protein [Bosea sp. R86505]|jgi:hypothetical protein|uniref:hypothetical protein n=1 Tax=Bosea sp. R86505 TaxID=3101710 RepID=UPI0036711C54
MAALAHRPQIRHQHRPLPGGQRQRDLFLVDLMAEARPEIVRELPMRSTAALGERRFTAWRGRSGRRYVASVFAVADEHALGFTDAVLLAVSPDRRILAARESGPFGIEAALSRWRDAVALAGASEIHVHLLAEDGISRRAALLDLMPEV